MQELMDLINRASEKIKSADSVIQLVSHLDADGICAASLMASMMMELGKRFQITIVKGIKPEIVTVLKEREPKLVIFTDIGSGYLDTLKGLECDVIVIDHHEIEGTPSERMIHINPVTYDLDFSGSGTAYLLAKEVLQHNSLAPLAIVGTVGDTNYSASSKIFENPMVEVEIGLNLFGRFSRPLYRSLELSGLPGMDGSRSLQFLSEIGISSQDNGKWKTLSDLNSEEKMRLTDAIVKESLKDESFDKKSIFGEVMTLKQYPDELKDAKEFATILNATANMNEPAVGIALCLGSKKALEYAKGIVKGYKRLICNYLNWIANNPSCMKQKEFATYIMAGKSINENLIGTIVSMLFKPAEKTLIGLANADDGVKISARAKGIDIREVIVEACSGCGGRGGGHKQAAGGTIPVGSEEKFVETCESLLKESYIRA